MLKILSAGHNKKCSGSFQVIEISGNGIMIGIGFLAALKIAAKQARAMKHIIDPELGPLAGIGSPKSHTFFYKGVVQVLRQFLIGIGGGRIVEIAANDHPVRTRFHVQYDHVHLLGAFEKGAFEAAQYIFTVGHLVLCIFFGDHIFQEFIIAFAKADRLKVNVVYAQRVLVDHHIGVYADIVGAGIKNDLSLVDNRIFAECGNAPMVAASQGGCISAVEIRGFKDLFQRINIVIISFLFGSIEFLEAQNVGIDLRQAVQDHRTVFPVLFPVIQVKQHAVKGSYLQLLGGGNGRPAQLNIPIGGREAPGESQQAK